MPARQGATALKIVLPDSMASEIKARCHDPRFEGNHSTLVETALTQFFEKEATQLAVEGFQMQLSKVQATLLHAVQEVQAALTNVSTQLSTLRARVDAQTVKLQTLENDVTRRVTQQSERLEFLIQALHPGTAPKKGFFSR